MLPASYHTGFAPRDGYPMYPELWRGCVGAWAPCLGPTGLTLRDWGGRQNHGTLTNMVPGDDWVVSGGRYALDFDGVNDVVEAARLDLSSTGTLAAWIKRSTTAASIIAKQSTTLYQWDFTLYVFGSKLRLYGDSLSPNSFVTSPADLPSEWCHVAGVKTNSALSLFVNGVLVASATATSSFQQRNFSTYFGYDFLDPATRGSVQIDDARIYNRDLNQAELRLLATRRGIAYEMYRPTYYKPPVSARRRKILTGQV